MKNVKSALIILVIFSIIIASCKEDESTATPDYAATIAGEYNGTITIGNVSAASSTTVTKNSETVVDLSILIGATTIPLKTITVSSDATGVYKLKFNGPTEGSFEGEVQGNTLTWILTSGDQTQSFTGEK